MPKFRYFCTALLDEDGNSTAHDIDVPKERVAAHEPASNSRLGRAESKPGEPPVHVFCEEHRGWASIAPVDMQPRRST